MSRFVDACSLCGSQVEHDADGTCCPDATIVQVKVVPVTFSTAPWTAVDEERWQAQLAAERERIATGAGLSRWSR